MDQKYNQYTSPINKNRIVSRASYLTLTPALKSSKNKQKNNPQVYSNQVYSLNKRDQDTFPTPHKRRAHTINSERTQNLIEKTKKKLRYFKKLPYLIQDTSHKGLTLQNQKYRYLEPTVNSIRYSKDKSEKKKKNLYKRICSVKCLDKNQSNNNKIKESYKQSSDQLRRYIYQKWKQKYNRNQISRYLKKIKNQRNQLEQNYKNRCYRTFLGKNPNFYQLKTQYALNMYKSQSNTNANAHQSNIKTKYIIPQIPQKQDLAAFIQNYECFNNDIDIKKLIEMPTFIVEYSPSQLYFGQMIDNSKEGVGILLSQVTCFEGIFQNNQKLQGVQINSSGVYKGSYRNMKRDGHGQFQWFNGEYYSGFWKDGHRHGNGIWTNKYGDSYNGSWIRGRGEGYGVYIVGQQQYKGDFVDFKKQGWGRQIFKNGDIFEGTFQEGFPEGTGVYIWADGTRYQGQYRNGYRCGSGLLKSIDGFVYSGQFVDQKPQGLCEILMPNGDTYQGFIKNGCKNGRGILTLTNLNLVLDGYWSNDYFIDKPDKYQIKNDALRNLY